MTRRLREELMSPQTAQAFLDGLPRMRAALLNSRHILGLVAYARQSSAFRDNCLTPSPSRSAKRKNDLILILSPYPARPRARRDF
jgi:hypothetical protein